MTNLITLTIPNDDHVALRAFGKALEEMAREREPHRVSGSLFVDQKFNIHPTAEAALAADQIDAHKEGPAEVDTTAQQVESLAGTYPGQPVKLDDNVIGNIGDVELRDATITAHVEISSPTAVSMITGTDSTGTPWDERIHSASKALNSDGTWRLRRKPKDMDEAEWSDYVTMIKADLQYPVECGGEEPTREEVDELIDASNEMLATIEPPVTPPGDDFHTDAGVVTEQTVAGIPPIPVPPVATGAMLDALAEIPVAPPLPPTTSALARLAGDESEQWDFPKLMKFLTERHGKIDVPTVNQLLAVDGLAALTDLNAHPDKIGPFVARVKAHLEE